MRISVFGLGYVGCVSAACLAHDGHQVIGIDSNSQKLEQVGSGHSPVVEPGLGELIGTALESGSLQVVDDPMEAVAGSDVSLICVGTPSNGNGSVDLTYVKNVCREIGSGLAAKSDYHTVVVRSTVLPGTIESILIPLIEEHSGRQAGTDFGVCMCPEFMREGTAIRDFLSPGLTIIGEFDRRSGDVAQRLFETANATVARTSIAVAEMAKYASNAFHALKVVFANEIGSICRAHGVDGQEVMRLVCDDRQLNISPTYLRPGFAFGGSCLPKDLRALLYRAKERDVECAMLGGVLNSNQRHLETGIRMIESVGRRKVGVLGLSFKPNTDDLRESPSIRLVETLVGRGYRVRVFDDAVQLSRLVGANKAFLERELPHIAALISQSLDDLVRESDVVVITNASPAFRQVRRQLTAGQTLIDLVGIAREDTGKGSVYQGICW